MSPLVLALALLVRHACAFHIVFYPPPTPPPIIPTTIWYCPQLEVTVWALWPGGASIEIAATPWLSNARLPLRLPTNVTVSRIRGAAVLDGAWDPEAELSSGDENGIFRLAPAAGAPADVYASGDSWRATLLTPTDDLRRGQTDFTNISASGISCGDAPPRTLRLCEEHNGTAETGGRRLGVGSGLPVIALTFRRLVAATDVLATDVDAAAAFMGTFLAAALELDLRSLATPLDVPNATLLQAVDEEGALALNNPRHADGRLLNVTFQSMEREEPRYNEVGVLTNADAWRAIFSLPVSATTLACARACMCTSSPTPPPAPPPARSSTDACAALVPPLDAPSQHNDTVRTIDAVEQVLANRRSRIFEVRDSNGEAVGSRCDGSLQMATVYGACEYAVSPWRAEWVVVRYRDGSFALWWSQLNHFLWGAVFVGLLGVVVACAIYNGSRKRTRVLMATYTASGGARVRPVMNIDAAIQQEVLAELKVAGMTAAQAKAAGYPARLLKAADYKLSEMKLAGYSAAEAQAAGYSLVQMWHTGKYTIAELRDIGISCLEVKARLAATLPQMREGGYTAGEVREAGYRLPQLKQAMYAASELRAINYTAKQLAKVGFTAVEMHDAAYPLAEMKAAHVTCREAWTLGYTATAVTEAGWRISDIKAAGYKAQQAQVAGWTLKNLLCDVEYTLHELKPCKKFSVLEMKEAREAGATATDARTLTFSCVEATQAGFPLLEMREAEYTAVEAKVAGWTLPDMRKARYPLRGIKECKFSLKAMRDVGFTAGQLTAANCFLTTDEAMEAGFTNAEMRAAGWLVPVK